MLFGKNLKNITKTYQSLNDRWQFKSYGEDDWMNAKVPGNVHLDLIENQAIPDPFFGQNESELQWISDKDWKYKLEFEPDKDILERKKIELFFHGIDTYADVYLNDQKVISANNMFHPWSTDIRDVIRSGVNELIIHFRSPLK